MGRSACLLLVFISAFLLPGWPVAIARAAEPVALGPYGGCDDRFRDLWLTDPPMYGYDVRELQERLKELQYDPGAADGFFGPATARAVARFQARNNLPPTGAVDAQTWQALGEESYKPSSAAANNIPEGPRKIFVDIGRHTLTLYVNDQAVKKYPVCVGTPKTPTPVGEWLIVHKSMNWGDGFGTRWLGLNVPWGIYGIHGTNKPWSIGRAESHGCIRMHNRDVEELYRLVALGTPVKIVGEPSLPPHVPNRTLQRGSTGPDVVQVQLGLRAKGTYWGAADGRYGTATEIAVKYWQNLSDLESTGKLSLQERKQLMEAAKEFALPPVLPPTGDRPR